MSRQEAARAGARPDVGLQSGLPMNAVETARRCSCVSCLRRLWLRRLLSFRNQTGFSVRRTRWSVNGRALEHARRPSHRAIPGAPTVLVARRVRGITLGCLVPSAFDDLAPRRRRSHGARRQRFCRGMCRRLGVTARATYPFFPCVWPRLFARRRPRSSRRPSASRNRNPSRRLRGSVPSWPCRASAEAPR